VHINKLDALSAEASAATSTDVPRVSTYSTSAPTPRVHMHEVHCMRGAAAFPAARRPSPLL